MTLNDALILSYVKRGIGYGYNILAHVKENRSDEWVEFSRAGLYKTLDKLEKTGHLKKTLEQIGSRPPRKVYRITALGENALTEYLESGFDFSYQMRYDLDAYLVAAVAASPDPSILSDCVHKRKDSVVEQIERLKNEWPEDQGNYSFVVCILFKRRMEFLQMELEWLSWLEETLEKVSGDVLTTPWSEIRIEG